MKIMLHLVNLACGLSHRSVAGYSGWHLTGRIPWRKHLNLMNWRASTLTFGSNIWVRLPPTAKSLIRWPKPSN